MTTTRVRDDVICLTLTSGSVKKAVKSCSMSKKYINTMMRTTIINILYHRLSIAENEFITKNFNNIPFKSFRSKSKDPFIREFHTYMLACKDAVDKNYLKEFYLYFIDLSSGDIIENYKFSFQYGENNESVDVQTGEALIEKTSELLRTLEDLSRHGKFSPEIQVKVEFTYFDDTPEEYEPPGFRSVTENESLLQKISKRGNSVTIGTLFTGFHMLKCRGRGEIFNFDSLPTSQMEYENNNGAGDENQVNGIEGCSMQVAVNGDLLTEDYTQANELLTEDLLEPNDPKTVGNAHIKHILTTGEKLRIQMNDTVLSQCIDLSSDEETQVKCPCELPAMECCTVDTLQCQKCKGTFHAPCQGYLDNSFHPGTVCCFSCKEDDDESVTGRVGLGASKTLHRLRYIVGVFYKYGRIPDEFKNYMGDTLANFEKYKVAEIDGNMLRKINAQVLHGLFNFNFKTPDPQQFRTNSKTLSF